MHYAIKHQPLLAQVTVNRRKPGQVVTFVDGQLCFASDGCDNKFCFDVDQPTMPPKIIQGYGFTTMTLKR